ncbi:MAG: hypothetical protein AAFR59_03995, partial [Bacteroidota bacterium]
MNNKTLWTYLSLLPMLLVTHVFMSWYLPSEGQELNHSFYAFIFSLSAFIVLLFLRRRRVLFRFLKAYFLWATLILGMHLSYHNSLRQVWPWTEIKQLVEQECPNPACEDYRLGIDYTFPLIWQEVSVNGKVGEFIGVDYGGGRTA